MESESASPNPRHRLILGFILAAAVILRVVNYAALAEGPCLIHHSVSDMAFFEEWSAKIADGDILTGEALHPMHTWHRRVAAMHLKKHPDKIGGLDIEKLPKPEQDAHYKTLWDEWYGGKTFHQEPAYPYAIALIRSVFGPDKMWVHVAQMLLGVCTLLLLYAVTKTYFGGVPALVATGLAAFCSPLLFFELFLLRAAPIAFATLALVFVFERTTRSPTPKRWLVFGVCTGIAMALKSHFLLFGLLTLGMAIWPERKNIAASARTFGWFLGGVLVASLPILIRNLLVGAPFLSTTSVGPVTFANANHAGYIGFGWSEDDASLTTLEQIMDESGGSFFGAMSGAIGSHDGFGGYLSLLWTKFTLAWQWAEFPNNVNFYFAQLHSTVLNYLPITFTVVAATALVGLIAAILQRKTPKPLLLLIALSVLQLVAFYSLARFRGALMVTMLPMSGMGIAWLLSGFRAKNYRAVIPTILACGLFAWWLQRPIPEDMMLVSSSSYGNALNNYYRPGWVEARQSKDWKRGLQLMEGAIEARPDYLDSLSPKNLPNTYSRFAMTAIYAEVYENYAHSLHELGRMPESQAIRKRAEELANTYRTVDQMRRRQK
jgi:4-amino-4-deoxy-L-arabinose transferase-like glycosyltransferase